MFQNTVRACVLKCKDYIPGKPVEEVKRELGLSDVMKMASNENPLGASPKAICAMIEEINERACRYPEGLSVDLVNKLAEINHLKPSQIVTGNGLDNIITMLGMAFLDSDDESIYADLTFLAYRNITMKMGASCVEVPMLPGENHDLDSFLKVITPRTKLIWICNPNNPTGNLTPWKAIESFLKKAPQNVIIIVDEAYHDFAESEEYRTFINRIDEFPNLVVLRTFSKIMGLAGLRIGFMAANEEICKAILKVREPFPVNRIAQVGALAALDDYEFIAETVRINYEGRNLYAKTFDEMGLTYCPSQTNFIYVEIPKLANDVFQTMLRDGVIIRPMGAQDRPNAIRISIGTQFENERTIESLKVALKS